MNPKQLIGLAGLATLAACGGGGGEAEGFDLQDSVMIADGRSVSYALPHTGRYSLQLSASTHGVIVEWKNSYSCTTVSEALRSLWQTCLFSRPGELVITNPDAEEARGTELVSLRITGG